MIITVKRWWRRKPPRIQREWRTSLNKARCWNWQNKIIKVFFFLSDDFFFGFVFFNKIILILIVAIIRPSCLYESHFINENTNAMQYIYLSTCTNARSVILDSLKYYRLPFRNSNTRRIKQAFTKKKISCKAIMVLEIQRSKSVYINKRRACCHPNRCDTS